MLRPIGYLRRPFVRKISCFGGLTSQPPDPILSLKGEFERDERPNKVYLGVGELLEDNGTQPKFKAVEEAESLLWSNGITEKKYAPILGSPRLHKIFTHRLADENMMFGSPDSSVYVTTPGGTGALALSAHLYHKMNLNWERPPVKNRPTIWLPDSTWPNHPNIFVRSGQLGYYPYGKVTTGESVDMISKLDIKKGDMILIHASCHNPTGVDYSYDEFVRLASFLKSKEVVPIIDAAYIGLANSVHCDLNRLRPFYQLFSDGLFVCYSFSKNMGLYGQRTGLLHICCPPDEKNTISSNLAISVRSLWSNPPVTGALIAETVFGQDELYHSWCQEVNMWAEKLRVKRMMLASRLKGTTDHMVNGNGLFTYVDLDKQRNEELKKKHGVYLVNMGSRSRLNICAINQRNVDVVANAINDFI